MKYFYIICLLLSSFFIYKSATAENLQKYAFFIPQNSFQSNISVKDFPEIPQTSPQQQIKKQNPISSSTKKKNKLKRYEQKPSINEVETNKKSTKQLATKKPEIKKETTKEKTLNPSSSVSDQQFTLEDPIKKAPKRYVDNKTTKDTATKKDSSKYLSFPDYRQKLADMPLPDETKPKFTQLYNSYCLELSTLLHKKKFPENYDQENTLSKANSILPFAIK